MNSIKERLKHLMAIRRFNSAELARQSGLPATTIYNILNGTSKEPRSDTLTALSNALGTSLLSADLAQMDLSDAQAPSFSAHHDHHKVKLLKEISLLVDALCTRYNVKADTAKKIYFADQIYKEAAEKSIREGAAPVIDKVFAELLITVI